MAEGKSGWSERGLSALERAHPEGMTVQQIVDAFAAQGLRLTEATFRKYVQLGLLPRSVRVARKGKRRGSQGLYPTGVVRQIDEIRHLMGQGYTIDEILKDFLFIRGDLDELQRQLERIYGAIERVLEGRREADGFAAARLDEARRLGGELVGALTAVEERMSMRARMARAAV
jgi:DNA-binding transcriptional MerR regulator